MGRLFDGPWPILIILPTAILLFGAPRPPAVACRGGLRVFKTETSRLKRHGPGPAQKGPQE